jgi:hypothetical protein
MRSVGADLGSLKGRTKREANAVGYPQSATLHERRYDQVRAEILTVVNTALARLKAEGEAHSGMHDGSDAAPVRGFSQASNGSEDSVSANPYKARILQQAFGMGGTSATLAPAERMRELAADPFIMSTETRASIEFHSCAHENQSKWWALEERLYITYPVHPSEEELLRALQNPAETMVATVGEMAATIYATTVIVANVRIASFSIRAAELEAFIQECVRVYTEKACRLLRPASEDQESRNRVAHLIDLYTTTALTSVRMHSHVQAALDNGMEWDEVMRMLQTHPHPRMITLVMGPKLRRP